MAENSELSGLDEGAAAKMFADDTPEAAVARAVARDPARHGTSLADRLERARRAAAAGSMAAQEVYERALIEAIGGNPDEMMVGNKPRYTVEENGDVRDHREGTTHSRAAEPAALGAEQDPEVADAGDASRGVGDGGVHHGSVGTALAGMGGADEPLLQASGGAGGDLQAGNRTRAYGATGAEPAPQPVDRATCRHAWPADPAEETRCVNCGITFKEWANS